MSKIIQMYLFSGYKMELMNCICTYLKKKKNILAIYNVMDLVEDYNLFFLLTLCFIDCYVVV